MLPAGLKKRLSLKWMKKELYLRFSTAASTDSSSLQCLWRHSLQLQAHSLFIAYTTSFQLCPHTHRRSHHLIALCDLCRWISATEWRSRLPSFSTSVFFRWREQLQETLKRPAQVKSANYKRPSQDKESIPTWVLIRTPALCRPDTTHVYQIFWETPASKWVINHFCYQCIWFF